MCVCVVLASRRLPRLLFRTLGIINVSTVTIEIRGNFFPDGANGCLEIEI